MEKVASANYGDSMPKTCKHIWKDIVVFENFHEAYLRARKGKRFNADALKYSENLEENLLNLLNHVEWESWSPGAARQFWVYDPKWREITAPPFEDRIVHHALVDVVEPLFEKRFIADSYACRRGKGAQAAVFRVQDFMRKARAKWGSFYIVKCDVKKYFASIPHEVLMRQIKKVISDRKVLRLWRKVLAAYGHEGGIGLPVGALTSQLSANIVLDALDHRVKDDLGYLFYVRYMDDFVFIVKNRNEAKEAMRVAVNELDSLGLTLNPKSGYWPGNRGVDFCGYRTWCTHILPRKRNMKKARKKFVKLSELYADDVVSLEYVKMRLASFLGYCKHCRSWQTARSTLKHLVLRHS
jgi:retron-type reverse transcriptase